MEGLGHIGGVEHRVGGESVFRLIEGALVVLKPQKRNATPGQV